jgi:hypothetical protein
MVSRQYWILGQINHFGAISDIRIADAVDRSAFYAGGAFLWESTSDGVVAISGACGKPQASDIGIEAMYAKRPRVAFH